jgi:pimeloyl-ACP methyl ester carboxylesterase
MLAVALLPPAQARDGGPSPEVEAFRAAWHAYAAEINAGPLQAGCAAAFEPARGRRRGAVLALHGFGGCPQQFAGLAPLLAAAGFDVVMPRLPGHGLPPRPDGRDDLTGLPTAADWQPAYDGFVATLGALMEQSPDERVIIGFSAGGGLALRAVPQRPALYSRLVLLAPLIGIRGGAGVEWLAWQLGRAPGTAALDVKHFGPRTECEAWQAAGRGGFCAYELRHAAGLVGLARALRGDWGRRRLPLPVHVFVAGDERYVSNAATLGFVAGQRALGAAVSVSMLEAVPHEMLTPYENVGREMTWLPGLQEAVLTAVGGAP